MVLLQLVGTIASLYLPSLNADIIDQGVAKGDTGYILRTGGWMLDRQPGPDRLHHRRGVLRRQDRGAFGRDVRAAVFHRVGEFSAREVNQFGAPTLISRSTNDVTADPDARGDHLHAAGRRADHVVGGIIMAVREDVGLSWLMLVSVPCWRLAVGLIVRRMVPQLPHDAGQASTR